MYSQESVGAHDPCLWCLRAMLLFLLDAYVQFYCSYRMDKGDDGPSSRATYDGGGRDDDGHGHHGHGNDGEVERASEQHPNGTILPKQHTNSCN